MDSHVVDPPMPAAAAPIPTWLQEPPRHLYVHVPFCVDRCTYCAFTTIHEDPDLHGTYVDAALAEWSRAPRPQRLTTLYLGGGTPGQLAIGQLSRLIRGLTADTPLDEGAEVTLEVNPRNIGVESLAAWHDLGINRLSVGVQSFRDDVLHRFARRHDGEEARAALRLVGKHWRDTWSADLLVGWSSQSAADVSRDTSELLDLDPPHVSVYGLTVEAGTPLSRLSDRGVNVTVNPTTGDTLDPAWADSLHRAGLERYEVSNFARPGQRGRHNEAYWRNDTYLGLGPGASSSWQQLRWTNETSFERWATRARQRQSVRSRCERLDQPARLIETVAVGLRTSDGIPWTRLHERFDPELTERLEAALSPLTESGHLIRDELGVRLPAEHLVKADHLVGSLIDALETIPAGSAT